MRPTKLVCPHCLAESSTVTTAPIFDGLVTRRRYTCQGPKAHKFNTLELNFSILRGIGVERVMAKVRQTIRGVYRSTTSAMRTKRAKQLRAKGFTYEQIAKELNCSQIAVYRYVRREE